MRISSVWAFGLTLLVSCQSASVFEPERVQVKDVELRHQTLRVNYIADTTLYYSPGVNVAKHDKEIWVSVVKCHIDRKCGAEVPGEFVDKSSMLTKIQLDESVERVLIVGNKGKSREIFVR